MFDLYHNVLEVMDIENNTDDKYTSSTHTYS